MHKNRSWKVEEHLWNFSVHLQSLSVFIVLLASFKAVFYFTVHRVPCINALTIIDWTVWLILGPVITIRYKFPGIQPSWYQPVVRRTLSVFHTFSRVITSCYKILFLHTKTKSYWKQISRVIRIHISQCTVKWKSYLKITNTLLLVFNYYYI